MGFWIFGDGGVETCCRVIAAKTSDGVSVRAKLTIQFERSQQRRSADVAADRCAELAEGLLREQIAGQTLDEGAIGAAILARLPRSTAPIRSLDVAGLHVAGELGGTTVRRAPSPAEMSAIGTAGGLGPGAAPHGSLPRDVRDDPVFAASVGVTERSPSHARAVIGAVAPLVAGAAERLLLDALEALTARGVALHGGAAPTAASHAERSALVDRWQARLGVSRLDALRFEANVAAAYLLYAALEAARVEHGAAAQLVADVCALAFPERSPTQEIGRYLDGRGGDAAARVAACLVPLVGDAVEVEMTALTRAVELQRREMAAIVSFLAKR